MIVVIYVVLEIDYKNKIFIINICIIIGMV
jgi:hypothetical protein